MEEAPRPPRSPRWTPPAGRPGRRRQGSTEVIGDDRELRQRHTRLFWDRVLAARGDEAQVEAMRPLLDFLPEQYFAAYLASEAREAEDPRILDLARLAPRLYRPDASERESAKR